MALINTATDLPLSDFARHHCWLINTTGKPHLFCPVDQAQEHNIKDIKVTYRSEGPNIKWEYLKKLHPAINIIRAVTEHIEDEFGTKARGQSHTVPSKEKDILLLQKSYHEAGYHEFSNGRKITQDKDKAKDYTTRGYTHLHMGKVIERWRGLRTFERSKAERWGNEQGSNDDSEIESDWSDGDGERGEEGEGDDDLRTAEFLKSVEAQLASGIDWYHPGLLEDDDGGAVDEGKGEDEGLGAHSQMYEEDLGYVEEDGEDEQSAVGVV